MDYRTVIVGGGAVGLAVAARLAQRGSVLLVERHARVGTETSARNSEVIHAGLYYPPEALRTKLCIRGKQLLYDQAQKAGVEMRQCGKWIVAQTESEHEYLEKMYRRAKEDTGVPLEWVPLDKAQEIEPSIIAKAAILNSPTTGIISAHSLMDYLEGIAESGGADIAVNTRVVGISPEDSDGARADVSSRSSSSTKPGGSSFRVECVDTNSNETMTIKTPTVINCAGLGAAHISNMLLPESRHIKPFFAKGNYFAYTAPQPRVQRLVYPCPSNYGSLGTHLTIDLGGQMKFGPDIEWIDDPNDLQVNSKNLEAAKSEILRYIKIDPDHLVPDYAGIRPKIVGQGSGFQDFVIRQEPEFPGFINLLNIESPGLTSSMAIAEYVENLLYE